MSEFETAQRLSSFDTMLDIRNAMYDVLQANVRPSDFGRFRTLIVNQVLNLGLLKNRPVSTTGREFWENPAMTRALLKTLP